MIEEINSELLVRETFKNLFPESFDGVLPVRKHKVPPSTSNPAMPKAYFRSVLPLVGSRLHLS